MFSQAVGRETENYSGQRSFRIVEGIEIPGVAIADRMRQTPADVHLTFLWSALAAHETRSFAISGAVTVREPSRSTGDSFNR